MIKEKQKKRNFGFIKVSWTFSTFHFCVKEKPQNVHLKLIFLPCARPIKLAWTQRFNLSYANCLLRVTNGFLNKSFQEIKLFICHCSFITLAQKTTMRLPIVIFLETFRPALSWIKNDVLFLYMFRIELLFVFLFITCHSRILQCVEFKDFCSFAVCSVLIFFHNLCLEYSWIPLEFCVCVCFQLFVYGFIFSLKKWAYLKKWASSPLF